MGLLEKTPLRRNAIALFALCFALSSCAGKGGPRQEASIGDFSFAREIVFRDTIRFAFGREGDGVLYEGEVARLYLPDASFKEEGIDDIEVGDSLFEASLKIGFPCFLSGENEKGLDYGNSLLTARYRLLLDESLRVTASPENFPRGDLRVYADPRRESLARKEDLSFLRAEKDVTIDSLILALGKPRKSPSFSRTARPSYSFVYDLVGDRYFRARFEEVDGEVRAESLRVFHYDFSHGAAEMNHPCEILEESYR